jgi:murein DD-endopeptidase MepM/ murein hydrolase activator NlpD
VRANSYARPTRIARFQAWIGRTLARSEALRAWARGCALLGATLLVLMLWHAIREAPGDSGPGAAQNAGAPGVRRAPGAPAAVARSGSTAAAPRAATPEQAGIGSTIEVIVARNDTLDAIFRRMSLDPADLAAIRQLPGIRQSLDFLKPGDAIKVTHRDGEVRQLERKVSETRTLEVMRKDDGFAAKMVENPVETRIRTATATIDSSVFQAAGAAGISDIIATKLANVFAWDIDFVLDIRDGDRFTAVYERIYQDGRYLRDGELLAAEFVNAGKVYRAVRFTSPGGAVGYYSPEGQPMRKAFLRAPVEFTRVSSAFNPHRRHPILDLIRGHMGTDYAAPTGTPVHAAGDGRVAFAGQRGGYGNAIVIAHSGNVSTLYGHMSRFAKNVRAGSHVQQGEVIGYVGMTGLATGPHLHYEYLVNGVHKNPQTVRLAGAEPLRADDLRQFREATTRLLAALAGRPAPAESAATLVESAPPSAPPLAVVPAFAVAAPAARAAWDVGIASPATLERLQSVSKP